MHFNRFILRVLDSPFHTVLPGELCEISYTAPVSGRSISLPAQCVADGSRFLVISGRPERKTWWRVFRRPYPAQIVHRGSRSVAVGRVLPEPERSRALETYLRDQPCSRRGIAPTTPVIVFETRPQIGSDPGYAP